MQERTSVKQTRRTPPPARSRWNPARAARVALVATLVLVTLGAGVLWGTYRTLGPDLRELLNQVEGVSPIGGTLVFTANGDTLTSFYRQKRVNVGLDDVPLSLKQAVLSVEDWRFYDHWGLDVWGLARAVVANIRPVWQRCITATDGRIKWINQIISIRRDAGKNWVILNFNFESRSATATTID